MEKIRKYFILENIFTNVLLITKRKQKELLLLESSIKINKNYLNLLNKWKIICFLILLKLYKSNHII